MLEEEEEGEVSVTVGVEGREWKGSEGRERKGSEGRERKESEIWRQVPSSIT